MKRQKTFVGRMSTTLMTAKMTCRTMQRTGATLAVRTESSVTWWTAWSRTSCVHSWQLIALSAMRTYAGTFRSASTQSVPLSSDANRRVNTVCMWKRSCTAFDQNRDQETTGARREAKRNSTCRTGGRKGHWAGDQVCPNFVAARRGRGAPTGAEVCRRRTRSTRRARIIRKVQGNAHPSGRERHSTAKLALRRPWMMKLVCAPVNVLSLFP